VEGVDRDDQKPIAKTDGFSMFTTAKTVSKSPTSLPPDGGPCSIAGAGADPSAGLRDGQQLMIQLTWMNILLLGAGFVLGQRNQIERENR
jgi:hypothetical protein